MQSVGLDRQPRTATSRALITDDESSLLDDLQIKDIRGRELQTFVKCSIIIQLEYMFLKVA
jgi:hypothetical protein